ELESQLTCTEAQLAVSRAVDGRLGRKERRRLRDHLAECPDCATFARAQQKHRSALRGLMLLPIPVSLTLVKGLQAPGTATAATLPASAATGAGVAASAGGLGATTATGGGLLAGGVALKAAAVVAAVSVAGGTAFVGAEELGHGSHSKQTPTTSSTKGKRLGHVAPRGVLVPGNGVARGKAAAPGQNKAQVHAKHANAATGLGHQLGHTRSNHSVASSAHGTRGNHSSSAGSGAGASHPKPTPKPSQTKPTQTKPPTHSPP